MNENCYEVIRINIDKFWEILWILREFTFAFAMHLSVSLVSP